MAIEQNFFQRLKHYRVEGTDPKENHATEVLAGCFKLSATFREIFLRLALSPPNQPEPTTGWRVATQVSTPEGDRFDLDFVHSTGMRLVVEVKVGDELSDRQISGYYERLRVVSDPRTRLAVLLRAGRKVPEFTHEKDIHVVRWETLAEELNRHIAEASLVGSTDVALIEEVVDYLYAEGIVMNSTPKDLEGLGLAQKAEDAVRQFFSLCSDQQLSLTDERIRKLPATFEGPTRTKWPQLVYRLGDRNMGVQIRAPGQNNWPEKAPLVIALVAGASNDSSTIPFFGRLQKMGWQLWQRVGRQWDPVLAENRPREGVENEVTAYLPLFGAGSHDGFHAAPRHAFNGRTWEEITAITWEQLEPGLRILLEYKS
jgi:hypothetical protein